MSDAALALILFLIGLALCIAVWAFYYRGSR
jgi:hypothetical protein